MLHPLRLNESKGMLKIGLMEKHLKNFGQGLNSFKRSRERGFILIKNYIKRLNMMHKC